MDNDKNTTLSSDAAIEKQSVDMTVGNIPRHLLAFSVPMLIGNLVEFLHNIVNAVWIGRGLGKILPADQIIVTTGLYMAGKEEQARRAAKIFCDGLGKVPNFYFANGFVGTWTAAAFQILANIYSNG